MIIGHFFTRKIRRKTYLLCQTTCSSGDKSPWSQTPEIMFEVDPEDPPAKWERRARKALCDAHPDFGLGDTLKNGNSVSPNSHPAFDIALKKRPGERKQSLISIVKSALARKEKQS